MDRALVLKAQRGELTEQIIYKKLAGIVKNKAHSELLEKISGASLSIIQFLKI